MPQCKSSHAALSGLFLLIASSAGLAQERPPAAEVRQTRENSAVPQHEPPPQAYADCLGKTAGARVQHRTREGQVAAVCVNSAKGLVARPERAPGSRPDTGGAGGSEGAGDAPPGNAGQPRPAAGQGEAKYSLEQAMSDRAQLNTIAFDALAFLTGDFAQDTFLPPGKVSDYFGFQYMRDIDARNGGHNTAFLTRIAHNMLGILNERQRARLITLAQDQQADIQRFAQLRLPLIQAFRQHLENRPPPGKPVLDRRAVVQYSADLYALDGKLAHERASVMAQLLLGLSAEQKAKLAQLKFGDSSTWPEVREPIDRRSLPHAVHVAVMTYASEMFSWQGGSLEADTYFCPERHGMYFGGFGLKTAPAMGKPDFSISTALTGDSGEAFLAELNEEQRRSIAELPAAQRQDLAEIARLRRAIASELRLFLQGRTAEQKKVETLARRYGELDGGLSYLYAKAFAKVGQSLSEAQKQRLARLRHPDPNAAKGPFLYSTPVSLSQPPDATRFFTR